MSTTGRLSRANSVASAAPATPPPITNALFGSLIPSKPARRKGGTENTSTPSPLWLERRPAPARVANRRYGRRGRSRSDRRAERSSESAGRARGSETHNREAGDDGDRSRTRPFP